MPCGGKSAGWPGSAAGLRRSGVSPAHCLASVSLSKNETFPDPAPLMCLCLSLDMELQGTMSSAARCAVTQGPPEGVAEHSLEKADSRKGGVFTGHRGGFKP